MYICEADEMSEERSDKRLEAEHTKVEDRSL